jgi:hypothetical protein
MLSNMKFLAEDNRNDHVDKTGVSSRSFSFPIFILNFNPSFVNNITRPINLESEFTIIHRN